MMRFMLLIISVLVASTISGCGPANLAESDVRSAHGGEAESVQPPTGPQPVLVELFTSEGCSSCPPADRNLSFLETQQPVAAAEIITLSFHVDYWDRLGWKDRFSSPLFSQRQESYTRALKLDSNYTPQMIVDGRAQFVGSDSGRAAQEVGSATARPKAVVNISSTENRIAVKLTDVPDHSEATVYAAIAEDGIKSRVERGENAGKTLEHISVVRELKTLGVLKSGSSAFEAAIDVNGPADANVKNLKVVIFVQENESRKVIGVGRARLMR